MQKNKLYGETLQDGQFELTHGIQFLSYDNSRYIVGGGETCDKTNLTTFELFEVVNGEVNANHYELVEGGVILQLKEHPVDTEQIEIEYVTRPLILGNDSFSEEKMEEKLAEMNEKVDSIKAESNEAHVAPDDHIATTDFEVKSVEEAWSGEELVEFKDSFEDEFDEEFEEDDFEGEFDEELGVDLTETSAVENPDTYKEVAAGLDEFMSDIEDEISISGLDFNSEDIDQEVIEDLTQKLISKENGRKSKKKKKKRKKVNFHNVEPSREKDKAIENEVLEWTALKNNIIKKDMHTEDKAKQLRPTLNVTPEKSPYNTNSVQAGEPAKTYPTQTFGPSPSASNFDLNTAKETVVQNKQTTSLKATYMGFGSKIDAVQRLNEDLIMQNAQLINFICHMDDKNRSALLEVAKAMLLKNGDCNVVVV